MSRIPFKESAQALEGGKEVIEKGRVVAKGGGKSD